MIFLALPIIPIYLYTYLKCLIINNLINFLIAVSGFAKIFYSYFIIRGILSELELNIFFGVIIWCLAKKNCWWSGLVRTVDEQYKFKFIPVPCHRNQRCVVFMKVTDKYWHAYICRSAQFSSTVVFLNNFSVFPTRWLGIIHVVSLAFKLREEDVGTRFLFTSHKLPYTSFFIYIFKMNVTCNSNLCHSNPFFYVII